MQLLHIDSSVLGPNSASRALTAEIVARQVTLHPGISVIHRDLAADAALHLSSAHLAAWQGGTVEDTALELDIAKGGGYLEELQAADIIVIGAPMYNFSIPSQLKAWIDRVVVAGKTFRYGPNGAEGLLSKSKKVFIASSRGNVYAAGSPAAALEHHESYLIGVLSFMGLTDVTIIRAEGLAFGAEAREAAMLKAREHIAAMAA
ncbi:MAG TPA: NAD(P)H-dependent oxidoreductase [Steroidobacteraceae bacterium]|jgi:FMN-dependent NADH-azoreductase|nr:NAD(P)H-dependent oxidoreductase [Steroidobacteraceae bacterium]